MKNIIRSMAFAAGMCAAVSSFGETNATAVQKYPEGLERK